MGSDKDRELNSTLDKITSGGAHADFILNSGGTAVHSNNMKINDNWKVCFKVSGRENHL